MTTYVIVIGLIMFVVGLATANPNPKIESELERLKDMKPTEPVCPKCQSKNVIYEQRLSGSVGESYGIATQSTRRIYTGATTTSTRNYYTRYFRCRDCGWDFDIVTKEMIDSAIATLEEKKKNNQISGNYSAMIGFVIAAFGLCAYIAEHFAS